MTHINISKPLWGWLVTIICCAIANIHAAGTADGNSGMAVIENAGFTEGFKGWRINYKVPTNSQNCFCEIRNEKTYHDKKFLVIDQKEDGLSMVHSASFPLKSMHYKLRMVYKTAGGSPEQKIRLRIQVINDKNISLDKWYIWQTLPPSPTWNIVERDFAFPENLNLKKGKLSIFFHNRGKFWLGDISLLEMPTEKPLVYKGREFYYSPRNQKQDPELSSLLKLRYLGKGYITYSRKNPRFLYPYSVPQLQEVTNTLETFGTPGQNTLSWFMVYALKDLKHAVFRAEGDLTDQAGNIIKKNNIDIHLINFWPQMKYQSGSLYYIIPELLLHKVPEDIPEKQNVGFAVSVNIPSNAKAGNYHGELLFAPENGNVSTIKLNLKVLPFKLQAPPNMSWGIILDAQRWDKMAVTEVEEELRELQKSGFNGPLSILSTVMKLSVKDGRIVDVDIPRLSKLLAVRRNLNLKNPLVLSFGPELEIKVAKALKQYPNLTRNNFPPEAMRDEQLQEGFITVLKLIDRKIKQNGGDDWYYFGYDEGASGGKKRLARVLWEYSAAKKANVKTVNSYYISYDKTKALIPYLDASWSMSLKEGKIFKQNNLKFWLNGGGTYNGQEGGIMPNRYLTGFMTYKSGADVNMTWTYQRIVGSAASDFDPCSWNVQSKDFCLTYPAREITGQKGAVSTLQWEGKKQGIIDYKYVYTLQYWIRKARQNQLTVLAEKAEKELNELLVSIPNEYDDPSNIYICGESYSEPGNFTNYDADRYRWAIAQEIMKLKKALAERGSQ